MRTNLTVFVAGVLLAFLFNSGPIGDLAMLVFGVVLASGIAGVRLRVEAVHAPGGFAALGRLVTAFVGLSALLLAAAYVYAVYIRGAAIRFDSPGWVFWAVLPTVGAVLLWASWSPTPEEEPTTEDRIDAGLNRLRSRNLEP